MVDIAPDLQMSNTISRCDYGKCFTTLTYVLTVRNAFVIIFKCIVSYIILSYRTINAACDGFIITANDYFQLLS